MGIFDWLFGKKNEGTKLNIQFGNKKKESHDFFSEIPKNGYGTCFFFTGITYEGMWKNGLKHGKGKETDRDGNIINEGLWEEGKFVVLKESNSEIRKVEDIVNWVSNQSS